MPTISTTIEIAAPPSAVRAKFLDFPSLPTYSPGGSISSITPKDPSAPIVPGSKLVIVLDGMGTFTGTVLTNTETEFAWRGSLPWIFTGDHWFRFQQGKAGPQSTTLVQVENFSGLLGVTMGESWVAGWMGMGAKTRAGFEGLNVALKRACEGK